MVEYYKIAERVMQELKVPVLELRAVLGNDEERAKLIQADGVHYTPAGSEKLAAAVAEKIELALPQAK